MSEIHWEPAPRETIKENYVDADPNESVRMTFTERGDVVDRIIGKKVAEAALGPDNVPKLPEKPAFGSPCNHCGLCCRSSLCRAAEMLLPDVPVESPCPLLITRDGKALCSLVLEEKRLGTKPFLQYNLAIGTSCSMPDENTTVGEMDRVHLEQSKQAARMYAADYPPAAFQHELLNGLERGGVDLLELIRRNPSGWEAL